MMQVARSLTDELSGCLMDKSHLILDRDSKYTTQFGRVLGQYAHAYRGTDEDSIFTTGRYRGFAIEARRNIAFSLVVGFPRPPQRANQIAREFYRTLEADGSFDME
jgi:hypothetical protein